MKRIKRKGKAREDGRKRGNKKRARVRWRNKRYWQQGMCHWFKTRIIKRFCASPPVFYKALFKCTRVCQGVFTVPEAEWQDFCNINWRKSGKPLQSSLWPLKYVVVRKPKSYNAPTSVFRSVREDQRVSVKILTMALPKLWY